MSGLKKMKIDISLVRPAGKVPYVGARLRDLRQLKKLTIFELASLADVSVGIISQVERGKSSPSMRTLQKICAALETSWKDFADPEGSDEGSRKIFVQRHNDRPLRVLGGSIAKEHLTPFRDYGLRLLLITLPPHSTNDVMTMGPGEKAGYVISGRFELTVGTTEASLGPRDSFQFKSQNYHKFANRNDEAAQFLWIMNVLRSEF